MPNIDKINYKGTEYDLTPADYDSKANVDGYYETFTSGQTEQIIATEAITDTEPYIYRKTGGPNDVGDRVYDTLVGGSVVWNQLVDSGATEVTVPNGHKYYANINGTKSIGASTGTAISINDSTEDNIIDLTAALGSTIADYVHSLETATAGAGVAWVRKYFSKEYYAYAEPHFEHVQTSAKNTVGFNQFDKDNANKIAGGYINNDVISIASGRAIVYIPCLPNTTYCASRKVVQTNERFYIAYTKELPASGVSVYGVTSAASSQTIGNTMAITITAGADAKYIVVWAYWDNHTEALDTLCINISGDRDGEYEAYKKKTYPLDSSLTLRGIPKLDSANRLYFDGDIYRHDGSGEQKYDLVDLGTLTYQYVSGNHERFSATLSGVKKSAGDLKIANIICTKYAASWVNGVYNHVADKIIAVHNNSDSIWIYDSDYTDAATFKTAMSGVYLLYEKATPEPFTAEPFQSPMVVDPLGTEQFIDYGVEQGDRDVAIPVGHLSEYPADLRGKLQHLPSLASADGRYCVQQSGKQMSLVADTSPGRLNVLENKIPDPPTTEGNYQLTCSINSIGSPTFSWVAVSNE